MGNVIIFFTFSTPPDLHAFISYKLKKKKKSKTKQTKQKCNIVHFLVKDGVLHVLEGPGSDT